MPTTTEFFLTVKDTPGMMGKICQKLADQNVNILAFQFVPSEGKSLVRLVVDKPTEAKSALDALSLKYNEAQVAQVTIAHRPGELGRVGSKLGEAGINIDYGYSGIDPVTKEPLIILGVADTSRAAKILDQTATAAGN